MYVYKGGGEGGGVIEPPRVRIFGNLFIYALYIIDLLKLSYEVSHYGKHKCQHFRRLTI